MMAIIFGFYFDILAPNPNAIGYFESEVEETDSWRWLTPLQFSLPFIPVQSNTSKRSPSYG
ncbi:hypothetical protein AKJ16_DCAP05415 [Drosera capensis]